MNNNHQFHLIKFVLNKELGELYTTISLRSLAMSMTGIFVPLYLLVELNYSFNKVLIFFIIHFFLWCIFTFFAAKLISVIGAKHTLLFSIFAFVIYYFMLLLLDTNPELFYYTAIIAGIGPPFFWVSFHLDFIKSSDRDHRGEEVSIYYFLSLVMTLIGPMVGGLILTYYNFHVLFVIVSILIFLSALPLFFSKEFYEKTPFNLVDILSKINLKDTLGFIGHGMVLATSSILWPIFIFFIIGGYLTLGFLASVVALINSFFTVVIGRYSDGVDKHNILRLGAVFQSAVWFIKSFVSTALQVFTISFISAFAHSMVDIPMNSIIYNRSEDNINYVIFREFALNFGKLLVLLIVLFTGNIVVGFLSSSLSSLFILFI